MPPYLAFVSLLFSSAVLAQAETPQKLEKIEVQAPDEVSERKDSTAAKIVVNRDEILRHGDTTLLDAMKRLPGVTVSGSGGRGSTIRMRGLGSGYTQILVNGEPMPPGFSLETIAPDLIERIEIVRGAMAQFSAQAIAGTINIVLRRAISTRQREVKVGTGYRNNRMGANASVQISDRIDTLSFTIPLSAYRFAFANDNVNEQVEFDPAGNLTNRFLADRPGNGRGEGFNMAPRLTWRFAKDHTLANETFVNYNRFRGDFYENTTTLAGRGAQYPSSEIGPGNTSTSARTNFTWMRPVGDDGKIEVKAGANHNTRTASSVLDAFNAARVLVLRRISDQDADDSGFTTNGKFQAPVTKGHSLSTGWDLARAKRGEDRIERESSPTGLPVGFRDETFDATVDRIAVYAQDEWDVTPKFSTYLGLRWEGITTRGEGTNVDSGRNRSSVWSPILHGLWKLEGKDQFRASIARTYKAPDTNNLIARRFFAIDNTSTTPDYQGNPGLVPELSLGLDTAYEHYFQGGGIFSVSAFVRRIDGVILREVSRDADGRYVSRPTNGGDATVRGIELDAKVNLGKLFPGMPGTDLRANLARNWSRVDSVPGPNNRLDQQSKLSGTVGVDHRFTAVPLTTGGSYSYKSGGPVRVTDRQFADSSSVQTLDLYALWKFSPKTQLRLSAQNLLARDYLTLSGYADAAGTTLLYGRAVGYRGFQAMLEVKL